MTKPVSIRLFLVDGDTDGLCIAEISNWSGKAIAFSRSDVNALVCREEGSQPGVYFLLGSNDETDEPVVYIGEAENVGKRIKQHRHHRDDWLAGVIFVSKDENLTKSHIRYLERRLIEIARSVGRAEVQNDQLTNSKLPESDLADMEGYLSRVLQLLPILGCDYLKPVIDEKKRRMEALTCSIKGLVARGSAVTEGFLVYKNSQAVLKTRVGSSQNIKDRRASLIESGLLKLEADNYIFSENYLFTSPSYAAAVVCGGNTNGLTAWKNKQGKSLKVLET